VQLAKTRHISGWSPNLSKFGHAAQDLSTRNMFAKLTDWDTGFYFYLPGLTVGWSRGLEKMTMHLERRA
jgi:hypothetical protein